MFSLQLYIYYPSSILKSSTFPDNSFHDSTEQTRIEATTTTIHYMIHRIEANKQAQLPTSIYRERGGYYNNYSDNYSTHTYSARQKPSPQTRARTLLTHVYFHGFIVFTMH